MVAQPSPSGAAAAEPEFIVGAYRLERVLGRGGMGEVWLGHHLETGGVAAVKLLRTHEPDVRPLVEALFAEERRAVARLSHPHVVSWHDIGPDYLAMRYVPGTNLARAIRGPMALATSVRIAIEIASALAHAHARGVVHRDVKPGNILLDTRGNAHLTDFGLALLSQGTPLAAGGTSSAGTPSFMAPEQRDGGVIGPAADQYSLARTLITMLLGSRPPIDGEEALASLPASLPASLVAALRTATAEDPAARYPSMEAFGAALEDAASRHFPEPPRLPEIRDALPFAWAKGGAAAERIGPHTERHDYTLGALEASGFLSAEACAVFRRETGYAELGFSVFGRRDALGPTGAPAAFARAKQLVLCVHGFNCTRQIWAGLAPLICRDHGEAVIVVPDLFGFGVSKMTLPSERRHLAPTATMKALRLFTELLGVAGLPTLFAGHSMGAAMLLTSRDDELPKAAQRIAVTPVFPSHTPAMRVELRLLAFILRTFGRSKRLHAAIADRFRKTPEMSEYTDRELDYAREIFLAASPLVQADLCDAFCAARPAGIGQLERAEIVVMLNDPVAKEKPLLRALKDLQIPLERVRRLAGGTHSPQWEQREHPEWTARNVNALVECFSEILSRMEGALPEVRPGEPAPALDGEVTESYATVAFPREGTQRAG